MVATGRIAAAWYPYCVVSVASGRHERMNTLLKEYHAHAPIQCPSRENLDPSNIWFPGPNAIESPSNGISIGSSFFAGLTGLPKTQTDHAMCNVCSNRLHNMHCLRCGLIMYVLLFPIPTRHQFINLYYGTQIRPNFVYAITMVLLIVLSQ